MDKIPFKILGKEQTATSNVSFLRAITFKRINSEQTTVAADS